MVAWPLFGLYLLAIVAFAGEPTSTAQALALAAVPFALGNGALLYGWSRILLFLGLCVVVTFSIENLSIATGFPFGHYHYEVGAGLPYVGAVPLIIGCLYFVMGYASWMTACLLFDETSLNPRRPFEAIALPIVAAFVMVQWDVVMDPSNATLSHAWIWHGGGGYFGVPLSNFFGWFLTVWVWFQLFALYLYHKPASPRTRSRGLLVAPTLFYLAVGLSNVVPYLMRRGGTVVDAAGHRWRVDDVHETAVIVLSFTMLFTSALALLRWIGASGPERNYER